MVRTIGQQHAATESDEEIQVFAFHALPRCTAGSFGKRGMGNAERARAPDKCGKRLVSSVVRPSRCHSTAARNRDQRWLSHVHMVRWRFVSH
jgi:hypothetical protein